MAKHYLVIMFVTAMTVHADNICHKERQPFSWRSYGNSSDAIQVGALNMHQNNSDYLYATGNGEVAFDMASPIQGKVVIIKHVLGLWIPIPCVDDIGTCTYDDVCALSPYKTDCPKHYTDINLPCHCPVLQGKYSFDALPIDVKIMPKWIEKGLYSIKIILNQFEKRLLSVKMTIEL